MRSFCEEPVERGNVLHWHGKVPVKKFGSASLLGGASRHKPDQLAGRLIAPAPPGRSCSWSVRVLSFGGWDVKVVFYFRVTDGEMADRLRDSALFWGCGVEEFRLFQQ